ncbi:MAG: glycoside hydrolase family 43 protein [Armatimonadota bacterium]|nr:glycoside hydrolase family 43 protein [Armatimonadota bacterium]
MPAVPEYVTNPLVPQRADPSCYKHTDGFYYFTGSVPAYDRIELMKASSLQGLAFAEPKIIWRQHDRGPMSYHIWAPEIHFINGRWYIYFAAGRAESVWDIRMYVLENEATDPTTGTWVEKGEIKTNWDSFSLDATTFEHRGTQYLVWAQKDPAIRGNTNLYIAAMENPWMIRGHQVELSRPELPWETQGYLVNEGPAVLKKNGRIFITYSASATDDRYCMGLLTAADSSHLLNPQSWTKSLEPVLETSGEHAQFGPGHNSFTTSTDGSVDILVYHARPYRAIAGEPLYDPNRHARVQSIGWAADGTPIFGLPVPDGPHPLGFERTRM